MQARLIFMIVRTCFVILLAFCCSVHAGEDQTVDPTSRFEPGVRLRLFRLAAPIERMRELAPEQSPNLDRTIKELELLGDESFMKDHPAPYIAELTAKLETKTAGLYTFRVYSEDQTRVVLEIDDQPVVVAGDAVHGVSGVASLGVGQHVVSVRLAANSDLPKLRVKWESGGEGLTPVPSELLTAEAFYFRPTNAGTKQLADETHRPGLRQKVAGLYPSLDIETIHPPEIDVPVGGLSILPSGALVVATFDAKTLQWPRPLAKPNGQLWLYHHPNGDPSEIRRELIADELFEPAGVCVVGDSIYVSQRNEITRFDQKVEDGKWERTTVASGWETISFHALSFGLVHEPGTEGHPGFLYMAKGTGLGGKINPPNHGSVWRVDLSRPNGKNVQAISGGHRTPNGLGWGPDGMLLVTDNQGEFTPANELNIVREGNFYGFFQHVFPGAWPSPFQPDRSKTDDEQSVTEAAVWLPQDEISNSPTQPLMSPDGWLFEGQLFIGDMRYGGIIRVSLDRVGDTWQGAAYHFTQGFEGGVNRLAFSPDGSLYVGGIGGPQTPTWAWVNSEGQGTYQGLQRLKPNGHITFDIERVSFTPGGFKVRFTKPVPTDWLGDVSNYQLQQWTYQATKDYGGPKQEVEPLRVKSATPGPNQNEVVLEVEGLKTNRVVHFMMDPVSIDGEKAWSAEAWYTLRTLSAE